MNTKICNTCGIEKELHSFYSYLDKRRNHHYTFAVCRTCQRQKVYDWRFKNPEKTKEIQKRVNQKSSKKYHKKYYETTVRNNWIEHSRRRIKNGLNSKSKRIELSIDLLKIQKGLCAICSITFGKSFDVDHDHSTGLIRGLLCRKCNSGLHYFEDKYFIEKAKKYIIEYPAKSYPPTKY